MSTVCVFEDHGWRSLTPLTWVRPCWSLVVGTKDVLTRVQDSAGDWRVQVLARPWLEEVVRERGATWYTGGEGKVVFVNGRTAHPEEVVKAARHLVGPFAMWHGETLIAFRLPEPPAHLPEPEGVVEWVSGLGLPRVESPSAAFSRWWDLVYLNGQVLAADLQRYPLGVYEGTIMPGVHLLDPAKVFLGANSQLEPGVVVDSRPGPVVVEKGVRVGAGSFIEGPVFLGRDCLVKPLSHIGPEVSAGPWCRLGGEVARTVLLGYANKQHYGFLGHSYVGRWVNLGAGTTTSNLKSTYGNVRSWVDGRVEDSGLRFLGSLIADHAKTAINTSLNTGTVVGVAANVFVGAFPPRFIPSFSWGPTPGKECGLEAVLVTASRVMERRGLRLTPAEAELLRRVWTKTIPERASETWEA